MANPQPTEAHLRIAHTILEQIMVSDFSKRQLSILLFILRLSWGCGKKEAIIPHQSDFEMVGVGKGHIKAEIDWLIEAKVITRDNDCYSFNKDYDCWRISRARAYSQMKVTEMVTLNLSHNQQKVTKTVTERLPKEELSGYQNGNNAKANLATSKEILNKYIKNKKEIIKKEKGSSQLPDELKELVSEFLKLPGWGDGQLANDEEWLSEFLADFPRFSILYLKACRDFHLARPRTKHTKGAWKSRLRNWMTNEGKWNEKDNSRGLPKTYTPQRDYGD